MTRSSGRGLTQPNPIRVMIVDDQETVGEGSAVFVEAFDDLELVGEAANGKEAICLYIKARPDVMLMDLMMPEMDGVAATQAIHQTHPEIKIIGSTSFADRVTRLAAEPWRAGARTSSITVCVALDEAGNGTMLRLC